MKLGIEAQVVRTSKYDIGKYKESYVLEHLSLGHVLWTYEHIRNPRHWNTGIYVK